MNVPDHKEIFVDQWYHFKDRVGLSSNFYYQQRYNSADSESAVTVLEELGPDCLPLLRAFHMEHRANASLVQLSSGEHKKLQLVKAFLAKPESLILDHPYNGLDAASCDNLDDLLADLAAGGTTITILGDASGEVLADPVLPPSGPATHFENFARLEKIHVRYDNKIILDAIDWTVKRGERWWLRGPNGAGKSTLLSLMVGDHPQAYANNIYLFDKKRGTGESIWEIKKRVGYISPELHWYFDHQTTCRDAIATGFFDTTGLYRAITPDQEDQVRQWLEVFHLNLEKNKKLNSLSIAQQRLTLLARALVKDPPVLILDEPCQGLDDHQARFFLRVVDMIMENSEKTLLYVSHRTDQLPTCLTHVLTLQDGRQVEQKRIYRTSTITHL
jgi:molybdate transport system ATP-binding protein